ncbi:MAG: exo-alpha-sialidase [Verrucomicrobia bacterium]|nr:exo-alpha-sialidase [Verrucomicrobiota bacterium]
MPAIANIRALRWPALLTALLFSTMSAAPLPYPRADFIVPPAIVIPHEPEHVFIGPGTIELPGGDLLMAAPWGSAPAEFLELRGTYEMPPLYRSKDRGRTWHEEGRLKMEWKFTGTMNNGGFTLLHLKDGRIALLAHRYVPDHKGGGLPAISFSSDEGATWSPAKLVGQGVAPDDTWYVMNDRLIQTRNGRLLVPVAHAVVGSGPEGDLAESGCFYSDDAGATWKVSQLVRPKGALRGMAEPCVAELADGRAYLLARSGTGFLVESYSGDGGQTWSEPRNTTLLSPCTSLTLKTLPDSRMIVFYNHVQEVAPGSLFPRCPLVYAISGDGGKSWSGPTIIDDTGWAGAKSTRELIYPSVTFLKEGMLVLYSEHFSNGGAARRTLKENLIGGGKRAILRYPAQ